MREGILAIKEKLKKLKVDQQGVEKRFLEAKRSFDDLKREKEHLEKVKVELIEDAKKIDKGFEA